jgi:hypothetical protein
MPQHSKKTIKTTGLAENTTRSDLSTARQPEDSYLAKIQPPALGNKSEWVRGAFSRGVSYRDLIKGSGLKTKAVLRLCGVDPDSHIDLVAELEAYRNNFFNRKD